MDVFELSADLTVVCCTASRHSRLRLVCQRVSANARVGIIRRELFLTLRSLS